VAEVWSRGVASPARCRWLMSASNSLRREKWCSNGQGLVNGGGGGGASRTRPVAGGPLSQHRATRNIGLSRRASPPASTWCPRSLTARDACGSGVVTLVCHLRGGDRRLPSTLTGAESPLRRSSNGGHPHQPASPHPAWRTRRRPLQRDELQSVKRSQPLKSPYVHLHHAHHHTTSTRRRGRRGGLRPGQSPISAAAPSYLQVDAVKRNVPKPGELLRRDKCPFYWPDGERKRNEENGLTLSSRALPECTFVCIFSLYPSPQRAGAKAIRCR